MPALLTGRSCSSQHCANCNVPAAVLQGGLGYPFGAEGQGLIKVSSSLKPVQSASCCAAGRSSPRTMQKGWHSPGKVATRGICTHRCACCCAAGHSDPRSSPACCRSRRSHHCSLAAGPCIECLSDVLGLLHSAQAAGVQALLTCSPPPGCMPPCTASDMSS